ncbi:helix-turn-helix transcriptional regulator [Aeromonas caviae]|nr:AlpA family phage regulatory protein [Aeromonas caviae]
MPQLLRIKPVLAKTGLSRSTMYALIAAGRFPAPVKLSARCSAWPSDQVDAWIAARIAG